MKSQATRIAVIRHALEEESKTLRNEGKAWIADTLRDYLAEATDESLLRFHSLVQHYNLLKSDTEV